MALDHQTMILIENNANKEEIIQKNPTVLIFDIYTLDKIVEFEVDLINDSYLDRDDYKEEIDILNPQFNTVCPTSEHFPKISCWNQGRFVLACVGATSKSKVFYEFNVYDTKTLNIISNIKRLEHDKLSFVLLDVTYN